MLLAGLGLIGSLARCRKAKLKSPMMFDGRNLMGKG